MRKIKLNFAHPIFVVFFIMGLAAILTIPAVWLSNGRLSNIMDDPRRILPKNDWYDSGHVNPRNKYEFVVNDSISIVIMPDEPQWYYLFVNGNNVDGTYILNWEEEPFTIRYLQRKYEREQKIKNGFNK